MAQRLPIPLALAKRERCVEKSLVRFGDPVDVIPNDFSAREPIIHTVCVTRRSRDVSQPRMANMVNDRYRDHAPSQLKADSRPAVLIDILA